MAHPTGRADPITEHLTRQSTRHATRQVRHDARARRYALRAVRPSPAREAAPEPEVWLPIADLGEILELEVAVWASELSDDVADPAAASGNVNVVAASAVAPAVADPLVPAPAHADPVAPAPDVAPPPRALVAPERAPAVTPERAPAVAPDPVVAPRPSRAPVRHRSGTRPVTPPRPRLVEAAVLGATVAAVAVGSLLLLGPARRQVTVRMDGGTFVRASGAATVRALLHDEHIRLRRGERVEPGLGAALRDGMTVTIEGSSDAAAAAAPPAPVTPAPAAAALAVPPSTAAPTTTSTPALSTTTTAAPAATSSTSATSSTTAASRTVTIRTTRGRASGGASWYRSPWGSDSCASRTLPFGTIVRIVNRDTGSSTTCRVADRGPVNRAWVLDLDDNVFRQLSPLGLGVIPVSISW